MQNPSKNNNFDILRLVLSVLVFFAHWNTLTSQNITNSLFHMGGMAVDMFFVLSGFLIFWSFDADQNKKHFYIKRFFRIFPLFALLVILQTLFFIGFSDGTILEVLKYFVANILFLNFLSPTVGTTLSALEVDAINGSLWTLKNEVVFYLFVPLIFMLYKKWGKTFLMIIYSLSVIYMFMISYIGSIEILSKIHTTILLFQFPAQVRLFIVGILLYVLFNKLNRKNIYLLATASLVSIILLSEYSYFKFMLYPFAVGILVIFFAYFIKHIKINFDFSYSFYILHFPVIQLALYFGVNPSNPIASFLGLFSVVLVLSYFSEIYIEKKFIRMGRNLLKRNREKNEKN